jgi:imidazolonepropionase-like amidohydrolase
MWLLDARVVDVVGGEVREQAAVHVLDGKIVDVTGQVGAPSIGSLDRTLGEPVIDLAGAYLLPGLISCHAHLSIVFPFHETDENEHPGYTALRAAKRAKDALWAGVTTVRTVGEHHRVDLVLRDMIARGWAQGPRIVAGARGIDTTGGHGAGFGVSVADGPAEFLKAARAELAAGADHVKIFLSGGIAGRRESFGETQVSLEEAQAAVYAARSHGTYVTAHAGDSGPIRMGLKAGVRCYEHGYHLDPDTAALMAESGAWLVPTLVVSRSPDWMRANRFEEWTIAKSLAAAPEHLQSIRYAVEAGVNIAHGTDMPPGEMTEGTSAAVREAEHLTDAGLTPLAVLRACTVEAARLLHLEEEVGSVEPGRAADFVVLEKNPLDDISALRSLFLVMKGGTVVRDDREGRVIDG